MEITSEDHIDAAEGAQPAMKVLSPGACTWNGEPESLFHLCQELGIGEADLVHDEPAPMGHLLRHFLAGLVTLLLTVKAKSAMDGLALEVCRIDGLEGHNLVV